MSVILLVDGLHELYAGTAGGGQVTKTAANEPKFKPQHLAPEVPAEPARQLLTETMLADRWVCSVARLQRWRTVGEGPQYLKIVGKVLYRLKDIEAYEEACLIRKVF
jgi:hypothetical protein